MKTKTKKQTKIQTNEDHEEQEEKTAEMKITNSNELTGWRIKTLEDAFRPRPPREYVVDGLFPLSSLNIVFGAEGSMKSLLLMDLGICCSEGLHWLPYRDGGGYQFETKKVGVLYIDVDNGSLTDDERINAFALSHGLGSDNLSGFKYMSMPEDFDVSKREIRDRIWLLCQALNIKLLIMDNLGLINSKDENSHEMASVMSQLRWLADRGMCVIVVHHQRKSNGNNKDARISENLRGHSSIPAALDVSLFVHRKNIDEESITIIPAKSRFAPISSFGAEFKYTWIEGTKELETAMFQAGDVTDEMTKAYSLVVMLLSQAESMTKTELVNQMMKHKVGQKIARQAIDKAVENKSVLSKRGPHNSVILSLDIEEHTDQKAKSLQSIIQSK